MRIATLLNRMHPLKGFVYGPVDFDANGKGEKPDVIKVKLREDRRMRGRCGKCGKPGPCHDHLPERAFRFVPLWGIPVLLYYAARRIRCPDCGVKTERLEWAMGKSPVTLALSCFLARWAEEMSWDRVARMFTVSWHIVSDSVGYVVSWGMAHRDVSGVTAIGVDELAYGSGQKYLTLVYQLDHGNRRLLWIGLNRTKETLGRFFTLFGKEFSEGLRFVCSDMWRPYLDVIAECTPKALNILDRFHVMKHLGEAIDETRREEFRRLKAEKREGCLVHSRWCFLKRPENLTGKQELRLRELLTMNLRSVKAYLMKEEFQQFWEYTYAASAGRFLSSWCRMVMKSRIEPMKKKARMLRSHYDLLLNWFKAGKEYNNGITEGLNNKSRTRIKLAYGYRTTKTLMIALFHQLGNLPRPDLCHRFV